VNGVCKKSPAAGSRLSVGIVGLRSLVGMLTLAALPGWAQCALPGRPGVPAVGFEAASVRTLAVPKPETFPLVLTDPERLSVPNLSLLMLIREAYGLRQDQISGGPKWLDKDQFNVVGTTDSPATREQMLLMLRRVLVERFHLACQVTSGPGRVLDLVVGPDGIHLKRLAAGAPATPAHGNDLPFANIRQLVMFLDNFADSGLLAHPVVDRTGLIGDYDIHLRFGEGNGYDGEITYSPDMPNGVQVSLKAMGLRLVERTEPVLKMAITHADRPVGN
jgi:uncharacterized protein (TIGR03435 family)